MGRFPGLCNRLLLQVTTAVKQFELDLCDLGGLRLSKAIEGSGSKADPTSVERMQRISAEKD